MHPYAGNAEAAEASATAELRRLHCKNISARHQILRLEMQCRRLLADSVACREELDDLKYALGHAAILVCKLDRELKALGKDRESNKQDQF